jgi:hypothetical protein
MTYAVLTQTPTRTQRGAGKYASKKSFFEGKCSEINTGILQ